MHPEMERVKKCLAAVRLRTDFVPRVGLILGSGLGAFADELRQVCAVSYKDIPGFAKVVKNEQILENDATLNISQYVSRLEVTDDVPKQTLEELLEEWEKNKVQLYEGMNKLLED